MEHDLLIQSLIKLGREVREMVRRSLQQQSIQERTTIQYETEGDTIYRLDQDVDPLIIHELEANAEMLNGVVLVAEGVSEGEAITFPNTMKPDEAHWRIIIDPIDGTRGIMYDMRSAFFLAGAAPNQGEATRLQDIEAAVMVELPPSYSWRSEVLWAVRGQGAERLVENLMDGSTHTEKIIPSSAESIYGGFGQISRFFHPGKTELAAVESELVERLFPNAPTNRAYLFEDQYLSTGGQVFELLTGRYRFCADLRASLFHYFARQGKPVGLSAHPYDLCSILIGEEMGMTICDASGRPLDGPLDTTTPLDWVGYANDKIRDEVQPILTNILQKRGWIP